MGIDNKDSAPKVAKKSAFQPELAGAWAKSSVLGGLGPTHSLASMGAAALTEGATTTTAAATPKKEYVDSDRNGKAHMLVDVMDSSKDILKENGIAAGDDAVLASLMMVEGGRNGRRSTLKRHFKDEASGLDAALKKGSVDVTKLASDPKAREALEKQLPEDQRYLLDQVIAGKLDLKALSSKDPAVKKAEEDKLLAAGIDKRVEQHAEMEKLQKAKKDQGKTFPAADLKRLNELQNLKGDAIGFDGRDAGATFADTAGLSEARFREIYGEGQQRFEPKQYRKLRDDYDTKVADYQAGKQDKPLAVKAGIGTGQIKKDDVTAMQDAGNHDLLADLATSYGTSQIMGLYGYNGDLKAKDGSGADVSYDLAALKNSGNRLSPETEDVNMQIAFLNMKAGYKKDKISDSLTDVDSLITLYNGSAVGSDLHTGYKNIMDPSKTEYDKVKAEEAKKKAAAVKAQSVVPMPTHNPLRNYAD